MIYNGWQYFSLSEYPNIQHVSPVADSETHIYKIQWGAEGDPDDTWPTCICECNPRRKYTSGNEGWIFVHDAFDGRLGIEWANEILKQ